jgi:hypothetical protein
MPFSGFVRCRFPNCQDLIRGHIFEFLDRAARPRDFQELDGCFLAEAEMGAFVARREIAVRRADEGMLLDSRG